MLTKFKDFILKIVLALESRLPYDVHAMATKLRWLSNYFPRLVVHDAQWLKGKEVGEPRSTALWSVEQLKRWGAVGIYVREEENEQSQ